jgi:hypothetical protein
LLCVINFSFFQSIYQFNTYTRPLEAFIIIVFSIIYLARPTGFDHKESIYSGGRGVASGFLLYFCSTSFQFVFSNVVSHIASHQMKRMIWNISDTFVLIMYLLFFVAIKNERSKG